MKTKIVLIHSAGAQGPGQGSNGLVANLQTTLAHDYEVLFPQMPDPENPGYERWKLKLEKVLNALNGNEMIIGHSLGGAVLLKYLSEHPYRKSIAALFLVATPYWGKDDWEIDEYVLQENFAARLPADLKIFLYHSRQDDIVPFSHLGAYAKALPHATVRVLEGNEHAFSAGLPSLTKDIRTLKNSYASGEDPTFPSFQHTR